MSTTSRRHLLGWLCGLGAAAGTLAVATSGSANAAVLRPVAEAPEAPETPVEEVARHRRRRRRRQR